MIRACIVSDSHGNLAALRLAVEAAGEVDCYIHLGDGVGDAHVLMDMTKKPVYAVRGNCDLSLEFLPDDVVTLGETRIFMTHGHKYGVGAGTFALAQQAEERNCSVALYGHTHVSSVEAQGRILVVNPGSPSLPRLGRKRSVAVLLIAGNDVFPRIVTL